MKKWNIREPRPSDYLAIGLNLREEDVREVEGLSGVPPLMTVKRSIEGAAWCRVAVVDDTPALVWGVTDEPGDSGRGVVWLLSTPAIHDITIPFIRNSTDQLHKMFNHRSYRILHNIADSRNALHMRWLKWMGAKFSDLRIKEHYVPFSIRR